MEMNSKLADMYRKKSKSNRQQQQSTNSITRHTQIPLKLLKEQSSNNAHLYGNSLDPNETPFVVNPPPQQPSSNSPQLNRLRNQQNKFNKSSSSTLVKETTPDIVTAVNCSKTYSDMPGNDHNIKVFNELIPFFRDRTIPQLFKIPLSKGIIVNGSTGCGKSSLMEAVANEHHLTLYRVYATQFMNALTGQSEKHIKKIFKFAMDSNNDCILLIEDIDILFKKGSGNSAESLEDRIIHQIGSCMDELTNVTYNNNNNDDTHNDDDDNINNNNNNDNHLVCVVINTCRISAIDPILRRSGRFEHEINIGIPNVTTREAILKSIVVQLPLDPQVDIAEIARITPGFAAADLSAIVRGAVIHAYTRFHAIPVATSNNDHHIENSTINHQDTNPTNIILNQSFTSSHYNSIQIEQCDLINASRSIKPASMKEGFTDVTGVTWNDIGALDEIREELKLQILGPILYKDLFEELGYTPSSGILLFGPPGCGKTLVAKALASEAGLNFISVRGPEIVSMYVGESERMLRDIFSQAQTSTPCVIFFDEIDSICVKRSASSSDSNSSARLVNQLLTEMDGLVKRENVHILAATNRPDILDPAVLRPGRFDKMLYIGLPNDGERLSIIKTITKNGSRPKISLDLMNEIVELTNNFSGADLVAFIRECTLVALKSIISNKTNHGSSCITREHIQQAQLKVKSSVSPEDLLKYSKMEERFSNCKK